MHQPHDILTKCASSLTVQSRFENSNARASEIAGTGLGLYLCRERVERYRGRIWFASSEEGSSTFFVALPIGATNIC